MTRLEAVRWLFNRWSVYSALLLLALVVQLVAGKYRTDWPIFAYWAVANTAGPMAILGPAAYGNTKGPWKASQADPFRFRTARGWSVAAWALTAAIILIEPLVPDLSPAQFLAAAGIVLAFVQVRALTAIGAVVFEGR